MLTNQVMISRSMSGVAKEPLPWGEVIAIKMMPIGKPTMANLAQVLKTSGRRKRRMIGMGKSKVKPRTSGSPIVRANGS